MLVIEVLCSYNQKPQSFALSLIPLIKCFQRVMCIHVIRIVASASQYLSFKRSETWSHEVGIYKRKQESKKKRKKVFIVILVAFLVKRVFFLFFSITFLFERVFSCFLTFLISFINSHLWPINICGILM